MPASQLVFTTKESNEQPAICGPYQHTERNTCTQNSVGRFGIIRARERDIIRSHLRSRWPSWKLWNVPPSSSSASPDWPSSRPPSLSLSHSCGRFREQERHKRVSITLDDDRTWLRSNFREHQKFQFFLENRSIDSNLEK